MTMRDKHTVQITEANADLAKLKLSWRTAEFAAEDGIGPLGSLHEAGDAFVAVAQLEQDSTTVLGSGVMIGPGLLLTATHVLEEFPADGPGPLFITFLSDGTRAWLPLDRVTISGPSKFDEGRKVVSDLSLVSCTLNSTALSEHPLGLAPMQIALPLIGERLWAIGFRHQKIEHGAAHVTPLISSGLVTAAFPHGRGERMASPCFEVNMDTVGGMSGGAVFNSKGNLVGIVSSSLEGGPSYITLIWEAIRLRVKGAVPKLAKHPRVSILGAKAVGLAKLEGDIDRNPWGDVKIRLPDKESKLLFDSIPHTEANRVSKSALNEEQLEEFVEKWGSDMESLAGSAAIGSLNKFKLSKLSEFLGILGIPQECLSAIQRFSVEDFDGVEDFEIISTSMAGDAGLEIEFFFNFSAWIWTVEVQREAFQANLSAFQKHFFNVEVQGEIVTMEVAQRGHFRGTMVFDPVEEEFSNVVVASAALKRPR